MWQFPHRAQLRLIPKQTFSISTGRSPVCSEQTVPGGIRGGLQEGIDQTACELSGLFT